MRFLLTTVFIFLLIVGIFELVFLRLGETMPYTRVIAQQNFSDTYYSPKYFNVKSQYKIDGVKYRDPEIIAIGTSRIMPFGQEHIADGTFYNAGVDASTSREMDGMANILQAFKDGELPRTIIIGVDPWLFNPNYPPNQKNSKNRITRFIDGNDFLRGVYTVYRFMNQRLKSYDLLVKDKSRWIDYLFTNSASGGIGVNAKASNVGFSSDGSFHYPDSHSADDMKSLDEWNEWLAQDQYRFAAASTIDQKALDKFKEFLKYCQEKNLKVIGLLLPFRNDFYAALNGLETHSVFFNKFREVVPLTMNAFGYSCYDFSSPETLNLTGEDFIDVHHMRRASFKKIVNRVFRDQRIQHVNGDAVLELVGQ